MSEKTARAPGAIGGLLSKIVGRAGRSYTVDPRIPQSALRQESVHRGFQLIRGLLRFRKSVFIGRKVRLRGKRSIRLGKFSAIGEYSYVDGVAKDGVRFGVGAKLGRFGTITSTSHLSKLGRGFTIGPNSGIGDFAHIGCSGGVTIGENVIIGPYVTFHSQEHNAERTDVPIREQGTREDPIVLENDIWVGARVTFLAGTTVGRGSIVAAGSVVRSSFPEYSVIGGVPARLLKTRTDAAAQ